MRVEWNMNQKVSEQLGPQHWASHSGLVEVLMHVSMLTTTVASKASIMIFCLALIGTRRGRGLLTNFPMEVIKVAGEAAFSKSQSITSAGIIHGLLVQLPELLMWHRQRCSLPLVQDIQSSMPHALRF